VKKRFVDAACSSRVGILDRQG